jgi:hypothetical protein
VQHVSILRLFLALCVYAIRSELNEHSAFVKADKSIYWLPSLYFQDPQNGSFIRVPERPEHKIYYYNRAEDNETIGEFPQEFRMIAGDQDSRSLATSLQQQAVTQWYCHDPDTVASGFPEGFTACGYGFAGSIHFPHCWNGEDFDIDNPYAHMSYPIGNAPDSGYCPASHPNVMPHIFIEFWFDVSEFNGLYTASDNPWVLSNGDATGYGFHADFINGWQTGILKNAMTNCDIGESGAPLSDCFDVWTDAERNACNQTSVVPEVIDGWLEHLPGCNPVTTGPARAVAGTCDWSYPTSLTSNSTEEVSNAASSAVSSDVTPTTSLQAVSASVVYSTTSATSSVLSSPLPSNEALDVSSTSTTTTDSSPTSETTMTFTSTTSSAAEATASPVSSSSNVTLPAGWTSAGCYTDSIHPRALSGINLANIGTKITSSGCAAYCDKRGYNIAGTEYGGQCFCGQSLHQSTKAADSICNMPCAGDATQICGGSAALNIFSNGGTSLASTKRAVRGA